MNQPQMVPSLEKLQSIQQEYFQKLSAVLTSSEQASKLASTDRRFSSPCWVNSNPFSTMAALYLLNAETLMAMTDAVDMDEKSQQKLKFMVQQWVDAASPSNFLATNPDAQQKLIDSKGESLRVGLEQLVSDLSKGRITQTDESVFELGRNLAITPGAVVFEN